MSGVDALKRRLNSYIRAYYGRRVLRGVIFWSGLSLGTFLLWLVLEYFGRFSTGVRGVLFWSYIGLFSAWLIFYVVIPLLRMMNFIKGIDYEEAAQKIGASLKGMDHKILDALSLNVDSNSDLFLAALYQKLAQMEGIDFQQVLDWKDVRGSLPWLLIPSLVLVVLLQWNGAKEILSSGERLVYYQQDFIPPAPFRFILPEDRSVFSGEDLLLEISLEGQEVPERISVLKNNLELIPVKSAPGRWTVKLENIKEELNLRVKALVYDSESVRISVKQKPRVSGVRLMIEPPSYTGLRSEAVSLKGMHRIPEGSKLSFQLQEPQFINRAYFSENDHQQAFEGNEYSFRLKRSLNFKLQLENDKARSILFQGSRLQMIEDAAPVISVDDTDSSSQGKLGIGLSYGDDYGLSRLERILVLDEKELVQTLPISSSLKSRDMIRLDTLGEGYESVELYYRVWDNDGINGRKYATTERIVLGLKSNEDLLDEMINQMKSSSSSSMERKEESQKLNERLEELQKEMLKDSRLDWKKKQDLREQLQKLENQRKESIERRESLEKLLKDLEAENLDTKDLEERLKETNKEEDELRALEEEIKELMENLNMKELKQKLDELKQENKEQMRRDDRMDRLLEDLLFQRDLLKEADRLQKLSEKLEEQSAKEEQSKEDLSQMKEEFKESSEKLEEMANENAQLKEMMESDEFQKASEMSESSLNEAQESLESGDQKNASESEKDASEGTKEMSESLSSMMMQMQSQALQMNMESLRRLLESVKQYSLDVEQNGLAVSELGKDDPRFRELLTQQSRLLSSARVIEDSLVVLANKAPQIKDAVFKELIAMMSSLSLGRDRLQNQEKSQSAVQHQYSMMAANNLALMLDASLQNMMSMMAMQQKGNQNCEKPGGAKPKPGQMSEKLSQMGEKVDRLEKGTKEGKGQSGNGSKEIAEILSEQEALRRMIQNAEEENGEGGSGDKAQEELLKDLDRMEDLLLERYIDAYKERFKRIETRLMEHDKAFEERKMKEQREAEKANGAGMTAGDSIDSSDKEGRAENLNRRSLRLLPFYQIIQF